MVIHVFGNCSVERRVDSVGVSAYKIIDGYVGFVTGQRVFFDESPKSISADMIRVYVTTRPTEVVVAFKETRR